MSLRRAIVGVSGVALTLPERDLFRRYPPFAVILFARNIESPGQLAALIGSVRDTVPGVQLMVDQEGGRVARLRPPHWHAHPSGAQIGQVRGAAGERAAFLHGVLIGRQCRDAGFDIVSAPVLDVLEPGADPVIGDRSFGGDPARVAALGRAMADGLMAAGVVPVAKHIPGHGRATADSHQHLPVVDASGLDRDIAPFQANAGLPWAMTAHVVYRGVDDRPATLSPLVITEVIRGRIEFAGLLMSDDLAMGALSGTAAARTRAALDAGCDVALHCSGDLAEGAAVLAEAGCAPDRVRRMGAYTTTEAFIVPALLAEREALLAEREALLADHKVLAG